MELNPLKMFQGMLTSWTLPASRQNQSSKVNSPTTSDTHQSASASNSRVYDLAATVLRTLRNITPFAIRATPTEPTRLQAQLPTDNTPGLQVSISPQNQSVEENHPLEEARKSATTDVASEDQEESRTEVRRLATSKVETIARAATTDVRVIRELAPAQLSKPVTLANLNEACKSLLARSGKNPVSENSQSAGSSDALHREFLANLAKLVEKSTFDTSGDLFDNRNHAEVIETMQILKSAIGNDKALLLRVLFGIPLSVSNKFPVDFFKSLTDDELNVLIAPRKGGEIAKDLLAFSKDQQAVIFPRLRGDTLFVLYSSSYIYTLLNDEGHFTDSSGNECSTKGLDDARQRGKRFSFDSHLQYFVGLPEEALGLFNSEAIYDMLKLSQTTNSYISSFFHENLGDLAEDICSLAEADRLDAIQQKNLKANRKLYIIAVKVFEYCKTQNKPLVQALNFNWFEQLPALVFQALPNEMFRGSWDPSILVPKFLYENNPRTMYRVKDMSSGLERNATQVEAIVFAFINKLGFEHINAYCLLSLKNLKDQQAAFEELSDYKHQKELQDRSNREYPEWQHYKEQNLGKEPSTELPKNYVPFHEMLSYASVDNIKNLDLKILELLQELDLTHVFKRANGLNIDPRELDDRRLMVLLPFLSAASCAKVPTEKLKLFDDRKLLNKMTPDCLSHLFLGDKTDVLVRLETKVLQSGTNYPTPLLHYDTMIPLFTPEALSYLTVDMCKDVKQRRIDFSKVQLDVIDLIIGLNEAYKYQEQNIQREQDSRYMEARGIRMEARDRLIQAGTYNLEEDQANQSALDESEEREEAENLQARQEAHHVLVRQELDKLLVSQRSGS